MNAMEKQEFDNAWHTVINWIQSHDHSLAEIEWLLNKAYPKGCEQLFYDDYGDILDKEYTQ